MAVTKAPKNDAIARFVFGLGFLDVFLAGMMVPLMPSIVRSFGGSVAMLGLMHTLQGAAKLTSGFMFGWIIDRFGFRTALLVALGGCALAYLPIAFAPSLWFVMLGKLLLGVFRQTSFVCEAFVASETGKHNRTAKLGRLHSAGSAGFIVGPLLGGFLGSVFKSNQTVALVQAVAFLLSGVIAIVMLPPDTYAVHDGSKDQTHADTEDKQAQNQGMHEEGAGARKKQEQGSPIGAAWATVIDNVRMLWECGALNFILPQLITCAAMWMMRSVFAPYLQMRFSPSSVVLGLTLSSQGVLGMVFSFLLGPILKRYGEHHSLLRPAIFLDAVSYVLTLAAPSLALFVVATIPARLASSIQRASFASAVSHHAPRDRLGSVLGVSQSATSFARMAAPTIAGLLLDKSEMHLAAACCVCCVAAVAVLTWQPFAARPTPGKAKTA